MTPRFLTLFWRQMVRSSWHHPWLTGLNILSIALGITVFLAVQIANRGALASFQSAAELTTGRAQLEVRGPVDDAYLPKVIATPGVRAATPMLEGIVGLPDHPGEYLHILGVDPFSGTEVFSFQLGTATNGSLDLERWLSDPKAIALHPERWQALGPGPLRVLAGTSIHTLTPTFVLAPDDAVSRGNTRFAAMDIGWAQELLGRSGELSSIQILLDEGANLDVVATSLRKVLPGNVEVAPPALRNSEMETLLGAFQLNLTALSLVSLIVGMFLIHNCVAASVVRRRTQIAILRATGATRLEVRALFLAEAALNALLGIAVGLGLAPLLARLMAAPVSASISPLYGITRIEGSGLDETQVLIALILGLAAALGAAWWPASEAARCEPARILRPGSLADSRPSRHPHRLGLAILLLAGAFGMGAWSLAGGPKELGFGSAAGVLAGFSLLVPWFATAVAVPFRRAGPLARCASDQFVRALPRNAITIAALSAALAMTVSVTVMIHSFRASVERWTLRTLVADLYIAPAVNALAGQQAFLPETALAWTKGLPEVTATATYREIPLRFRGQAISLSAAGGEARGQPEMKQGTMPFVSDPSMKQPDQVAISESLARRFRLTLPTKILLPTPEGERAFQVSGIYQDFTQDRGIVMMPRTLFAKYWQDSRINSLALRVHDPAQTAKVTEAFREKFGSTGEFAIYDNAALRERVKEIFDQTFAVTYALRAIAILVAVAGVLFSLSILVMEREREIGVLRAVGASRGQILGVFLIEGLFLAVSALLCGMVSGAVLAMVLTWVINQAFFGWTIALQYPLLLLAATPLWFLPAAILAALLPAWRASRVPPAQAVRFE